MKDHLICSLFGSFKATSVSADSRDNVGGWGYEINVFSHFGPDLSSPGLTLVPRGIIKPRILLKKSCQNMKGDKQMVIG